MNALIRLVFFLNFFRCSFQCFCDDDIGIYGRKSETECWIGCSGNPFQTCGGKWRNSVYRVSYDFYNLRIITNVLDIQINFISPL